MTILNPVFWVGIEYAVYITVLLYFLQRPKQLFKFCLNDIKKSLKNNSLININTRFHL